jgi:mRNA interferase YafQ
MAKRGKRLADLEKVAHILCTGGRLPPKYREHRLAGRWNNHRECHIRPDWLLIYRIEDDSLFLERTGSHSDLFE